MANLLLQERFFLLFGDTCLYVGVLSTINFVYRLGFVDLGGDLIYPVPAVD
jgi:hypothetical protein